jgi:hypothetical protein
MFGASLRAFLDASYLLHCTTLMFGHGAHFFFADGKSVQTPSNTSAAMQRQQPQGNFGDRLFLEGFVHIRTS